MQKLNWISCSILGLLFCFFLFFLIYKAFSHSGENRDIINIRHVVEDLYPTEILKAIDCYGNAAWKKDNSAILKIYACPLAYCIKESPIISDLLNEYGFRAYIMTTKYGVKAIKKVIKKRNLHSMANNKHEEITLSFYRKKLGHIEINLGGTYGQIEEDIWGLTKFEKKVFDNKIKKVFDYKKSGWFSGNLQTVVIPNDSKCKKCHSLNEFEHHSVLGE